MADAISIQELIDARTDAKTLEEAVNGDAVTTVLSRLGETYPTLSNALNQIDSKLDSADTQIKQGITNLFENGGLPATPFATKALMTASVLVDGKYAMVTDDTVNNGLYVKTAGAWVKSNYDPLMQAKADATAKADAAKAAAVTEATATAAIDAQNKANAAQTSAETTAAKYTDRIGTQDLSRDNLLDFNDAIGNTFASFDSDSGLVLHGLDDTVQNRLASAPKYGSASTPDLVEFVDDNDNPYMSVDSNSELHLADLNDSVQENIRILQPHVHDFKTPKRMYFTSDVTAYTNQLVASGATLAPVPFGLQPSKYTVNDVDVLAMTMPSPVGRLSLDTPYGNDDQVVHPFVFELAGTMRGYKFIMAINPYTAENQENPVIYGSNDLVSFDMLTGFDQPLDTPPDGGFLSDSCFTYDPTRGELVCFWRVTRRPADKIYTAYWCSRTKDLLNWTPKELLLSEVDNDIEGLTSPSILFDPKTDTWHMWNISARGYITHRTTGDLYSDNWSAPTKITAIAQGAWHIEVKYVGDKFVMIINKSTAPENYYLGISADGANWLLSTTPMLSETLEGLYKASFIPRFNSSDNVYFDVFYTTNQHTSPDLKRRLFHTQTNAITTTGA